jgi:hypothetical protein
MINTMNPLLNSWFSLIGNALGSTSVFISESVPENYTGHYVELRCEGETEDDTKHSFRSDNIIITDIVTQFTMAIDKTVAESIDGIIKNLVRPTPQTIGLPAQSGIQILIAIPETTSYLEQYSSGKKYYRKIVRYRNRIVQT